MVKRLLELPKRNSFFLFGPRQTGKSTLVDATFSSDTWKVDLLLAENHLAYAKDPSLFRREAEEKIRSGKIKHIFIDEIQRVPPLLNEVQALLAAHPRCQFALTGSSARKLRRGGANLLGGRAVERHLFPFCRLEAGAGFKLEDAMQFGTLPALLGKSREEKADILTSYVHTYLREEILSEGIIRNLGGFSRFLEVAAAQDGEVVNFSAIAREVELPVRTVQSYYEILEDTLLGIRLEPWRKSVRKRLASHAKFYLFDLGVSNAINQQLTARPDPMRRGRLFEQFIVLETYRLANYLGREVNLYYWRTNHGAEVDLLIVRHGSILAAVEIKSSVRIGGGQLSGLRSFREEHSTVPLYVICLAPHAFEVDKVKVLPWEKYLESLLTWLR